VPVWKLNGVNVVVPAAKVKLVVKVPPEKPPPTAAQV
jgi:hypothetical protein